MPPTGPDLNDTTTASRETTDAEANVTATAEATIDTSTPALAAADEIVTEPAEAEPAEAAPAAALLDAPAEPAPGITEAAEDSREIKSSRRFGR